MMPGGIGHTSDVPDEFLEINYSIKQDVEQDCNTRD